MKKLSKDHVAQINQLLETLQKKAEKLTAAVETYNRAVQDAFSRVETVQHEYNEAVVAINDWKSDTISEMSDYQSEHSDKWQEGENGQKYQAFIDAWEGLEDVEESDLDSPEDLEFESPEGVLEGYPKSPDDL